MQNTQSLCIRVLLLITGVLTQCLALKQISVMQGDTLILKCPLKNYNMSDVVEWRNPEDLHLFFNRQKAVLKDSRNKFITLTKSEFSIHVTDITFKDGGVYRCLRYNTQVLTKRHKVVVIGAPKLEKDEQKDKTIIRCSASANEHPPRLSWLMENGLEFEAHPYYELENTSKKYTAVSQLNVKTPKKRITVKCLVHHSALHGSHLENYIHIGSPSQEKSTISKYSSTTLGAIDTTAIPTLSSSTSFTNNDSKSETTDYSNTIVNETTVSTSSSGSTDILSNTSANEATEGTPSNTSIQSSSNTTANETTESISEITEGTPSNTSSKSSNNRTGNGDSIAGTLYHKKGNSPLLVLLVTCLIICLFVVLTFFLVRLRKAHIAWKKENEESEQSVESSKSKSSSEEKLKQQQKGRGFWNTSFTKYKAEEAVENEAQQATPASVQVINENPQHFISRSSIKETEL